MNFRTIVIDFFIRSCGKDGYRDERQADVVWNMREEGDILWEQERGAGVLEGQVQGQWKTGARGGAM